MKLGRKRIKMINFDWHDIEFLGSVSDKVQENSPQKNDQRYIDLGDVEDVIAALVALGYEVVKNG